MVVSLLVLQQIGDLSKVCPAFHFMIAGIDSSFPATLMDGWQMIFTTT